MLAESRNTIDIHCPSEIAETSNKRENWAPD